MKINVFEIVCAGIVALGLPASADSLVAPAAATAQSRFSSRAPMHTIDGSGMSSNPVAVGSTASTKYDFHMWLSSNTKQTWIMFDMGETMTLTGLRVWNYNEPRSSEKDFFKRGVKTCELRYGDSLLADGETYANAGSWGTYVGTLTFACANGQDGQVGEDVVFTSPITTRYVMLRVLDNYGQDNYTGLSEVRFYSRTPQKRWRAKGESSNSAYAVRGDDLLQTAVVSTNDFLVINTGNNDPYSKGTTASLTDGTFGAAGYSGGLCIKGGTVTYNLDTVAFPGGYDISEVHVYAGWTGGRESPMFVLSCRRVGEADFTPVASASYICEVTTGNRNTHLALTDLDLRGVEAIMFDFGNGTMQQNNGVGYKEIDVIRGVGGITVSPVAATSESAWKNRTPDKAIDGVDLSPARWPGGSGVTVSVNADNMWLSNGHKPTWIAFDLGTVRTVKGFHLWNYNEKASNGTDYSPRGIKTAGVYVGNSMPTQGDAYSTAGENWGTLVTNLTFASGTAAATYSGEDYFFSSPATGRYFQLAITENHGTENYTGIAEIVFYCDNDETVVTRGSSGTKTIEDSLHGVVTIKDGTGTAAPITVDTATTRLHTLRGENFDGVAQIDTAGKALALGKIVLPEGTAGMEIMSGSTLTGVEGQRNWMEWTCDADLVIHGTIADNANGNVSLSKTGTGTVVVDGTDTHRGATYYEDGGYRQTGGTVNTRGATFTHVVCEFIGGVSRATYGIGLKSSDVFLSPLHDADWRFITCSGTSSLVVTNGGVMKVGFIEGNPYDLQVALDGGTLATSALGSATPWFPALGRITIGAGGAFLDTSATGAVADVDIDASAGALHKTGANTLTLRRRVTGAAKVSVDGGALALSLPAPIIHYDFNAISGTTVPNLGTAGAALDGVISGSPATVEGVDGSGLLFSESNGVATAGSVTMRQYTYAAWVKSAGAYNKSQRIVIGGTYSTAAFLGYLGTNNDKYWAFARSLGDLNGEVAFDENWHHLATTYDGETITLYVDGMAVQTNALTHNRSALTVKIGFGNNVTPNAEYWNGAIDEAYVFDRALSSDEVTLLKNGSWRAVNVLDPDTELSVAADAMIDLGGTDQTVATFSIGGCLKCYGETTWGAVGSGAEHETSCITGTGILRVKGPAPRGTIIIFE